MYRRLFVSVNPFHARHVREFITAFKDKLCRRLGGIQQNKRDWTKHVNNIIIKGNITEYNTTKIILLDAVKQIIYVLIDIYRATLKNVENTLRLLR